MDQLEHPRTRDRPWEAKAKVPDLLVQTGQEWEPRAAAPGLPLGKDLACPCPTLKPMRSCETLKQLKQSWLSPAWFKGQAVLVSSLLAVILSCLTTPSQAYPDPVLLEGDEALVPFLVLLVESNGAKRWTVLQEIQAV